MTTKTVLRKNQRIKYTEDNGNVEFGIFSHYDTFPNGTRAVYAYWSDSDDTSWVEEERVELAEVEENSVSKANININQDIIKLIESGYNFKFFYGTTFDGKEFHIEVEDQL